MRRTPTVSCPACGERRIQLSELTVRGLLHQAVEAFTSLDARLWRTLGDLLRRPGALTVLYHHGPRKPYIGPFALFLDLVGLVDPVLQLDAALRHDLGALQPAKERAARVRHAGSGERRGRNQQDKSTTHAATLLHRVAMVRP